MVDAVGAAELDNVGGGLGDAGLRLPALSLVLFRVFVNVPAAVGALAGGLVAAEVAGGIVDMSAAAGFTGAEWLSIFVIWAAADWLDVDWLFTGADSALGSGSRLKEPLKMIGIASLTFLQSRGPSS